MKSYFAVSFFIVCFLCTQALSGPARAPQQEAKCFYKQTNDQTNDQTNYEIKTAKINETVGENINETVDDSTILLCTDADCLTTVEAQDGTRYKCVEADTWKVNNSRYYFSGGAWHDANDENWEPPQEVCALGEIRYNGDCISCEKLTGASNATTTSPFASNLYECYLPKDNEYMDDKGIFTYTANCVITCTDETQEYCTSA